MKKFAFALGVLTLTACARPIAPEGGPKDTTPPKVVPESSTPNLSTRFSEQQFKLSFDEWVTLQEVGTQVLVSPPLLKRPEVTLKGRTVTFKFDKDEVLRPNTTYTVNFGTSVKDLHESNPAKDLRFVFSTGDVIDSLSVTGIIVDAYTSEPVENISVLLYDTFEDSIVQKDRPYYLARSDKSGQFSIPNVRAGSFKCVAIEDTNLPDMKWDGVERIGFPDSLILVNDSLSTIPALRVFAPPPPLLLRSQQTSNYGLIRLGFNAPPDTVSLQPEEAPGLRLLRGQDKDTLLFWYDLSDSVAWNLLAGKDTIALKALSRSSFMENNRLFFGDEGGAAPTSGTGRQGRQSAPNTPAPPVAAAPPPRTVTVRPGKPVQIPFNNPVVQVDTALFRVIVDSTELRDFDLRPDSSSPRALLLNIDWKSGSRYECTFLPGALTDFYGTSNTDTLRRAFITPEEKQLGGMNLTLENLQAGNNYILRLMNGNNLEEERFFNPDSTTTRFIFQKLQPVAYTLQLIEDQNGNQRWDPGDYYTRRQPEQVFIKKLEPLRANWEVETVMQAARTSGRRGG